MPRRSLRFAAALVAALALAACGGGAAPGPLGAEDADLPPPQPPVPYAVAFTGEMPPELATLLQQVVESAAEGAAPATSRLAIRQRAQGDQARLEQALRAQGYFDGTLSFRIVDPDEAPPPDAIESITRLATRPEAVLVFDVVPGPRYTFGALEVALTDNPDAFEAPSPKDLGLVQGEPARTQAVLDAEQKLLGDTRKAGFALAKLGEREAVVDHASREMDVTLRLDPGRRANFGTVSFTGGDGIDTDFLRARVPVTQGELYDPDLVTEGQNDLFDTNLFSTIIPRPAEQLTDTGELNLAYDLTQRPPRTIGAELNYESEVGPGARLFWEHRNIFGAGERLRAEIAGSEQEQSLTTSLRKPDFLRPRQSLLTDATLRRERLEAYDADSAAVGVSVERELSRQLRVSLGSALRYARIEDLKEPEQTYALLSFPGKVDWDFANDRFSPTAGGTVLVTAAPFVDLLGTDRRFLKGRFTTTRYIGLSRAPQLVLALRGSVGALGGVSRDDVPADERFYAGGGGSIRGIGFELAGPLDDDDKPLGGRSVVEGSMELRTRFANDFGFAVFLDAGTVDTSVFPSFEERVLFGAGPSFRYFTPVGPIRFDVGFPLNPRNGVDSSYQLYFSIGQSF
jgi:translocation and assembly module TamA